MPTTLTCWELFYDPSAPDPVGAIGQLNADHEGNWIDVVVSGVEPVTAFEPPPPIEEPQLSSPNVYCGTINHPPVPEGKPYWKYRVLAYDGAGTLSEPSSIGAIMPVPEHGVEVGLLVGVAFLLWIGGRSGRQHGSTRRALRWWYGHR